MIAALRADGTGLTSAPWVAADNTLMPIVNQVVVHDAEADEHFAVPLDLIVGIVQAKPVPDMSPPRYLLRQHPDPATMARLRRVATMH